ncbi:hypothetical protein Tco_0509851, partial [Tanacetum coccineum]
GDGGEVASWSGGCRGVAAEVVAKGRGGDGVVLWW